MRLLVIRHSTATPQGTGVPDSDRRLTPDGEARFRAAARGLARLVTAPDVLLTSPVRRARETAAIAAAAWGGIALTSEPALASGDVDLIFAALEEQPRDATVVMVGHEPTVSALVAELIGATSSGAMSFEPGAAALLEVSSLARHGGRLVWFLPPAAAAVAERP